jgi:hypothetical protein
VPSCLSIHSAKAGDISEPSAGADDVLFDVLFLFARVREGVIITPSSAKLPSLPRFEFLAPNKTTAEEDLLSKGLIRKASDVLANNRKLKSAFETMVNELRKDEIDYVDVDVVSTNNVIEGKSRSDHVNHVNHKDNISLTPKLISMMLSYDVEQLEQSLAHPIALSSVE